MTTLTSRPEAPERADAAQMGPGWDYYLDRLAAARAGRRAMPEWEHYYPALAEHYQELHVPAGAKHERADGTAPPAAPGPARSVDEASPPPRLAP